MRNNSCCMQTMDNTPSIALYGLGTETERFLNAYRNDYRIIGLLDGFRETGEMYGYPVISIQDAIDAGVSCIIVIARPGSCKAIAKRIGDVCRREKIDLFDVRGKDLLRGAAVAYDLNGIDGYSLESLKREIDSASIVSFDLFDTLITRKLSSYTDVFELVGKRLEGQNICIPDFPGLRLFAEKECSKYHAPTLSEIYAKVLDLADHTGITAKELAEMEWDIDRSTLLPRKRVFDLYKATFRSGKKVMITTDSYYTMSQLSALLSNYGLDGYSELLVSCDKGTSKTQKLFEYLIDMKDSEHDTILHIGDDEKADIESAQSYGIKPFRIYSSADLFDLLGGLGINNEIKNLSDRLKEGLFISRLFNDPFMFEKEDKSLTVSDAEDIGYLFCGPAITDFTVWLRERLREERFSQVLFSARDGFLVRKLYDLIDKKTKTYYFLTSRTAAIRAGVEDDEDIAYVDSMKYFGTDEESLLVRFGIKKNDLPEGTDKTTAILKKAKKAKENNKKYIEDLKIAADKAAFFDFVAKGTTQMYLQRLFDQHLKGFYFLRLEPEFMSGKGLDIEPFYSDKELEESAVFENYYILETVLTAPHSQVLEFDEEGASVYDVETRSEKDIDCSMRAQKGVEAFFKDYIVLLPEEEWRQNKKLDELFLSMINHIKIEDPNFLSLRVEDPFFGRMTDIKDVIG